MRARLSEQTRKTEWFGRALGISSRQGVAFVFVGLGLSWAATYLLGGAGRVPPHFFYFPILIAAARFGAAGGFIAALTSGFLAGPLVPLDVDQGTQQQFSDWVGRTGFFVANGLLMAFVIERVKTGISHELRLTARELELARHKEAVIQTVSHEFRTPLTAIVGIARVLARPEIVAESARSLVHGLDRSARRLDNLVRVVLAAAGTLIDPEDKHQERVTLRDLVEGVVAMCETPEDARTVFHSARDAEVVVADPELLGFLLQALVDNALKFSPAPTPVEISARRVTNSVEIRVRDQGPGMTDAEMARAFEAFTQRDESTTRSSEGLGLGLYAARKTAQLLGGTLELSRAGEQGTEAVLTIPQSRESDRK